MPLSGQDLLRLRASARILSAAPVLTALDPVLALLLDRLGAVNAELAVSAQEGAPPAALVELRRSHDALRRALSAISRRRLARSGRGAEWSAIFTGRRGSGPAARARPGSLVAA